jgi:hypothetical protein
MPKVVILSSFPQWTLYWPSCYFNMPRDVIGLDGFGGLANYYYLDQWNFLDPAVNPPPTYGSWASAPDASADSLGYQNNDAWNQFVNLDPADKSTIYNAQASCVAMSDSNATAPGCDSIPQYLFNMCPTPPNRERYQQQVGQVQNPYYQDHPQYLEAFKQAKKILENDSADPIYVVIPAWLDPQLIQVRNSYLKMTHEQRNAAHGGAVNMDPCNVRDSVPCYADTQICWAPAYPDANSPSFQMPFEGPAVPWLMSCGSDPGVGTNVLHLYIGHPNMSYFSPSNVTEYQAWPLTPEVQWIGGPLYAGNYTGASLPYFAGRRVVWRVVGYNYGYTTDGNTGVDNSPLILWNARYSAICNGAANTYKNVFYKFRNFGTRIFTYNPNWNFSWYFDNLDGDRRNDCPSTQFYSESGVGWPQNFQDFVAAHDDEDYSIDDCQETTHLNVGEAKKFFPLKAEIERAKYVGNQLAQKVEGYYDSVDPGSAEFFRIAIEKTGLADYNASYEGTVPGSFKTADGIVEYVRNYFKNNP